MSFTETCLRVAEHFIQTVVVIDDRGFAGSPATIVSEAVEPDGRGYEAPLMGETDSAKSGGEVRDPPLDPEPIKHGLDGMTLTRGFAVMGIACALYVPEPEEVGVKSEGGRAALTSGLLARRADIVVVDWLLDGRTSIQARDFIKRILQGDAKRGGRLRLLAVYTGADDLKAHRQDVGNDLTAVGIKLQEDDVDSVVALAGPQCRVVFLHKDHGALSARDHAVSEAELPQRLIVEFARLTEGIMPCVALAAISAVREGTHNILAKFNRSLDPALAAHRGMLATPSDSESYALQLVSEELQVRLEGEPPNFFRPTATVFNEWVDHLSSKGRNFNLADKSGNSVAISSDRVKSLLAEGGSQHGQVVRKDDGNTIVGPDKVWRQLTTLFSASSADAEVANMTFARMALLRREAYGAPELPEGWLPKLSLGAVIALLQPVDIDSGESVPQHYVCLQPLCDAVHLKEARSFPLLPLTIRANMDKFSLVVRTRDGRDMKFLPKTSPYEVSMVSFAPTTGADFVRGTREADGFRFQDVEGRSFEWLGEMRPSAAQRVAHQLSSQFGRVGLDEFEWLRLNASRS